MTRKTRTFAVAAAVGGLATVAMSNNFASALGVATTTTTTAGKPVAPSPSSTTIAPTSGPSTTGAGPTTTAAGPTTTEGDPTTTAPDPSGPSTTTSATTKPAPPTTADAGVASLNTLATSSAETAAQAALEACSAKDLNVTVAVVDRDGVLIALVRNEKARAATVDVATGKAYASASFQAPSGVVADLVKANPGIVQIPKFVALRGALPISADKEVVGAIGVSGAPTGEQDEVCAKAGVEAIAKKLSR